MRKRNNDTLLMSSMRKNRLYDLVSNSFIPLEDYVGEVKSEVKFHQYSRASFAITTPDKLYVYDGGATSEAEVTASHYMDTLGYDEIEILFLSHYHNHHIGGIPGIIEYYYANGGKINNIFTNGYRPPLNEGWDMEYERFYQMEALIAEHNINYQFLKAEDIIEDDYMTIHVINPDLEVTKQTQPGFFENANDYSNLCLLIKYGDFKCLWLADTNVPTYGLQRDVFWFNHFARTLKKITGTTKVNYIQIPHHGDPHFAGFRDWWLTFSPELTSMDNQRVFNERTYSYIRDLKTEFPNGFDYIHRYIDTADTDAIHQGRFIINMRTDGTFEIE